MDEYQLEFATGLGESYLNCPACGKEMIAGHSECFSCGVVVTQFKNVKNLRQTKESVGGIDHLSQEDFKRLDKAWKKVVVNYHDKENHNGFIKLCHDHRALPFAIHHYSRMLEIDSEDDIADVMRKQALSLVSIGFEEKSAEGDALVTQERSWNILKWVNWIGLFFSSFCIVAGMITPGARNLIGLGVSFLLLFVALLIYRRKM